MRRLVLALCVFFATAALFGQDTLVPPVHRKAAFRTVFNFDFRRTYVNGYPARFYGFRLGAQREKDMIAIGFYGLGDPYIQEAVELPGLGTREVQTDFDFTSITYERFLFTNKRWVIGVPLSVGLGNYRKSYRDGDALKPYSTNELVPLEASLHVDYNIFWWIFVGVGGGYRHVLAADPAATTTLSDWTYYVKAGLRVGELMKRARNVNKNKKNQGGDGN